MMFGMSTKRNTSRLRGYLSLQLPTCQVEVSLSGEKTKGYTRCVECLDDTDAVHLPKNSKIVYMGHHRFLPKDHSYCKNIKDFDGTIEKRLPPKYRDGHAILREVNKLEVVLGKGHNAVAAPDGSLWKKKSVF